MGVQLKEVNQLLVITVWHNPLFEVVAQFSGQGNKPDPVFVVLKKREHRILRKSIMHVESAKLIAVVTHKAVVGTEPHITIIILNRVIDLARGQTLPAVVLTKKVILRVQQCCSTNNEKG